MLTGRNSELPVPVINIFTDTFLWWTVWKIGLFWSGEVIAFLADFDWLYFKPSILYRPLQVFALVILCRYLHIDNLRLHWNFHLYLPISTQVFCFQFLNRCLNHYGITTTGNTRNKSRTRWRMTSTETFLLLMSTHLIIKHYLIPHLHRKNLLQVCIVVKILQTVRQTKWFYPKYSAWLFIRTVRWCIKMVVIM